ncbi:hypothetical protein BC827DRAFT_219164 [Russula dissimulans]|jgi:hypothetical protein|nr:hypothetical protein BC827DRAFT_219164 [Russula dissimulans]
MWWARRMRERSCPWEVYLEKVSKSRSTASTSGPQPPAPLHPGALYLVDLALCGCTSVAGVSCRCATFGTGELVLPILCARFFLQEAIDRLRLVRDTKPREGYESEMYRHLFVFSERCFHLHAVSSHRSAISASFSCFFLRDVSSIDPMTR